MKKTYQSPQMETFSPFVACDPGLNATSVGKEDVLAKDRAYEEDNEAFNVTDGEGMASYGDLW